MFELEFLVCGWVWLLAGDLVLFVGLVCAFGCAIELGLFLGFGFRFIVCWFRGCLLSCLVGMVWVDDSGLL